MAWERGGFFQGKRATASLTLASRRRLLPCLRTSFVAEPRMEFEEAFPKQIKKDAKMAWGKRRLFPRKKSYGKPYACKQTTAFAVLAHLICGRATKGVRRSFPKANKNDRYKNLS